MFLYTFQYTVHNENGSFLSTRKIKANGIENAIAKFKEDFTDWNEEVPTWNITELYGIEEK